LLIRTEAYTCFGWTGSPVVDLGQILSTEDHPIYDLISGRHRTDYADSTFVEFCPLVRFLLDEDFDWIAVTL
jgi:hypothetical protein